MQTLAADSNIARQLQQASLRLNASCPLSQLIDLCNDIDVLQPDLHICKRGERIFTRGDDDRFLYSVRKGSVKLARHRVVGEEQVLGFYFPGEVFGLDGLSSHQRENEAIALDDGLLYRIPIDALTSARHSSLSLQRALLLFGNAAIDSQEHAALVNQRQARTRVAAFILDIANRSCRPLSANPTVLLPMSRQDIASYLGLSVETVSRRLCDLERDQLIAIDEKRTSVQITDLEHLQQSAHF